MRCASSIALVGVGAPVFSHLAARYPAIPPSRNSAPATTKAASKLAEKTSWLSVQGAVQQEQQPDDSEDPGGQLTTAPLINRVTFSVTSALASSISSRTSSGRARRCRRPRPRGSAAGRCGAAPRGSSGPSAGHAPQDQRRQQAAGKAPATSTSGWSPAAALEPRSRTGGAPSVARRGVEAGGGGVGCGRRLWLLGWSRAWRARAPRRPRARRPRGSGSGSSMGSGSGSFAAAGSFAGSGSGAYAADSASSASCSAVAPGSGGVRPRLDRRACREGPPARPGAAAASPRARWCPAGAAGRRQAGRVVAHSGGSSPVDPVPDDRRRTLRRDAGQRAEPGEQAGPDQPLDHVVLHRRSQ